MPLPLVAAGVVKLLTLVAGLWGAGKVGELASHLPELSEAYDDYVEKGGNLGYTGWQWEVLTGTWKDLPEYQGSVGLSEKGQEVIANTPGLQEAIDVFLDTGDSSGLNAIMEQTAATVTAEEALTMRQPVRSEVENIQGLLFVVSYDEEGNALPFYAGDFLGEAPVEGLTPWQETQVNNWANGIALQQKQLDFNIEKWGQQLGLSRDELELQRLQIEQQMGLSKAQLAWQQHEFMLDLGFREDQLALSQQELDFQVNRWGVELALSRDELAAEQARWAQELAFEEKRWAGELGLSQEELAFRQQQWQQQFGLSQQQIEQQQAQWAQQFGLSQEELAFMRESEAARLALEERQIGAALAARPGKWVESAFFETGTPPITPAWLPKFAPGTAAGRPITQQPVKTPSAQTFGKMPWSQREMLGGFAEFAAQPGAPRNIQEIQERVGRTLPRERTRQARWQPAFQV